MASVRVRIDDFEDGVLPLVCAGTGVPCERRWKVEATSRTPGWVWLFLLAFPWGLLAILVLSAALRKRTPGFVPYTDAHQAAVQGRVRTAAWFAVSGMALVVGGVALLTQPGFRSLGAVVAAGAAFVTAFSYFLWLHPPGSAGLTLDRTGRWVEMDPVAPAFARAYEEQEARRRAARRAEAEADVRID